MKVAIHQPEHFPYMGFFQKMEAADLFVILDDAKFQGKRHWQNRNLIKLKKFYKILPKIVLIDPEKTTL